VLPNPNPEPIELSQVVRDAARSTFLAESTAPVWGYLGGWDERKGLRELFEALRLEPTAHLLFARPGGPGSAPPDLLGGLRTRLPLMPWIDRIAQLGGVDGSRRGLAAAGS